MRTSEILSCEMPATSATSSLNSAARAVSAAVGRGLPWMVMSAPGELIAIARLTTTMTSDAPRPNSWAAFAAQLRLHRWATAAETGTPSAVTGGRVTWIQGIGHPLVMEFGGRQSQPLAVVIGASGILAPLGALLGEVGFTTWGVSRSGTTAGNGWARASAMDCQDAVAVGDWIASCPKGPELLVAYAPAVLDALWPQWGVWAGRVVVVATSKWCAPEVEARPWDAVKNRIVLQLGWRDDGEGGWHTAKEISLAALEVVDSACPNSFVLGRIRPWEDRPG